MPPWHTQCNTRPAIIAKEHSMAVAAHWHSTLKYGRATIDTFLIFPPSFSSLFKIYFSYLLFRILELDQCYLGLCIIQFILNTYRGLNLY
uniref:Ovule protein n=1 Tax=Macrostomum lignano TaxID=282301 RepID=A0A1I8JEC1_9PLAT